MAYQAKGTCVSVEYLVLGMLENNVYLISDGESTLVVDPSCTVSYTHLTLPTKLEV